MSRFDCREEERAHNRGSAHGLPRLELLGTGCAAVDELFSVASYPEPDTKVPILEEQRRCGGLIATGLISASRLDVECGYAGVLGEDEYSSLVLQTLEEEGVDISLVEKKVGAGPVRARIIVDNKDSSRTILYSTRGVFWPGPASLPLQQLGALRVLFVDHFTLGSLGAEFLGSVRDSGIDIVADIENSSRADILDLMKPVNHLILSDAVARRITGRTTTEEALRALWCGTRNVVVITEGRAGCSYMGRGSGSEVRHIPAFSVDSVDTTGCGDVFHGAYAAALVRGLNTENRLMVATAAAACNAQAWGAYGGTPTLEELQTFLNGSGYEHVMNEWLSNRG